MRGETIGIHDCLYKTIPDALSHLNLYLQWGNEIVHKFLQVKVKQAYSLFEK